MGVMPVAQSSTILPPEALGVLLAVLFGSSAMFGLLIWRWTARRGWVELSDWAINHRFRLEGRRDARCAQAVQLLPSPDAHVSLSDGVTEIQRIRTPLGPGTRTESGIWHILVRRLETEWPATILRPASRPISLADFWPLASMYTMWPGERFVVYGHDRAAVRTLGRSHLRGLLPSDIGLVLTGNSLILDFSARPFDPLELQRMTSLAEQLVAHLPPVMKA
jgi:hypothetical protein